MGCVTQIGEQGWNVGRRRRSSPAGRRPSAGRRSTASAARRCRRTSTALPRSRPVISTSSSRRASRPCRACRWGRTAATCSDKLRRALADRPAGDLRRGDRGGVGLTREAARRVLVRVHRRAVAAIDEGRFENEIVPVEVGGGRRGRSLRSGRDAAPGHVAREARRAPARLQARTASSPPGTRARSSTAPPRCWSRARRPSSGSGSSRARVSSRSGSRASTRIGCSTESRGVRAGAREGRARVGRHGGDRGQRGFRIGCPPVPRRRRAARAMEVGDVNPNGGGISLGHPLGATGARDHRDLLNELERREARYGIASMCIGQGQAIAGVVERL